MIINSISTDVSKEKLMQDLQLVVNDAEELLKATAGVAGDKVTVARERIQESLSSAKERLAIAQEAMYEKTHQAARVTDDYVHDNPWQSVGIGAAAGLVVGMLISRGR
jgi:ElaB/YqjD/DUF883 family membrane-anchored ribosome-binding protein